MEKKDLIPGGDAIRFLKNAALYPQRRGEMIACALQNLLASFPAIGTALIWPCQDRAVPWKVYYVGPHPESIHPWIAARLDGSFDAMLGVLQRDLCRLSDMPFPHLICLQPAPMFPAGLWVVWTTLTQLPRETLAYQEEVRLTLEALIQMQSLEMHYFPDTSPLHDQALVEGLKQGDPRAMSVLLSMARLVGNGEMAFWGRSYQDVVECSDQKGAKQGGFGFAVPYGKGMGGRIAASGAPILIEDYHTSPYRHPSAAPIVDREQLRSAIGWPVRTSQGQEGSGQVTGILYVAHRTVKSFSLVEQLLVQRVTHLLEPLSPPTRPSSFLSPGLNARQAGWHKLILQANHIESLETWIGQYIHGTIIVTDSEGRPYVTTRAEQLERLRVANASSTDGVQVISLEAPGVSSPGQVYLRSGIALPPADWPGFFTDLVMACNLIIGRLKQARDHLAHQREQWLRAVLQEKPTLQDAQTEQRQALSIVQMRYDGYQLGLPAGEGQLWVIAWPTQEQEQGPDRDRRDSALRLSGPYVGGGLTTRQRMLVENIVLNQLECPLLFLGDDIGVILFGRHAQPEPAGLHEALLTLFDAFWIVYGAYYHSMYELKKVLTHSVSMAQKVRRERYSKYLLDVQNMGLESLLVNPRLSEDLCNFATRQLTPLLEYDKSKGTDLTTTFVLTQTLGSVQAVSNELGVHVNTIRYRLRKAEDILGAEEASSQGRISWGVASSIWMSLHPVE